MVSLRRSTSLLLVRMMFSLAFSCSSHSKPTSSTLLRTSYSSCRNPLMVFSSSALLSAISFLRELLSATMEAMVSYWILFLRSRLLHYSRTQARSRSFFCSSVSCDDSAFTLSFLSQTCFSNSSPFTRSFIISSRSVFSLAYSVARCLLSSFSNSLSFLNFSFSLRYPSRQTSLSSKEVRCETASSAGNQERRLGWLLGWQVVYLMVENLLLGDFVKVLKTWLFGPASRGDLSSEPKPCSAWKLASERVSPIRQRSLAIFLGSGETTSERSWLLRTLLLERLNFSCESRRSLAPSTTNSQKASGSTHFVSGMTSRSPLQRNSQAESHFIDPEVYLVPFSVQRLARISKAKPSPSPLRVTSSLKTKRD